LEISVVRKLGDIAEIRAGYQFREKVAAAKDANVAVIQIKDIDENHEINVSDLVYAKVENPKEYLVSQGEVLFLSRGSKKFAAVIKDPLEGTIATSYFYILRPNSNFVHSAFLGWSINQPEFQNALLPFVKGTSSLLISKIDFQNISIRVPSFEIQERIVQLQSLFDHECQLTATIQKKRRVLLHTISRNLTANHLSIKGKNL